MKEILKDNLNIVLRFDKDEEVISALIEYAKNSQIKAAAFTGIGACSSVELGFYNAFIKDYRKKPFVDNFEIISFVGNIAIFEGSSIVHAHGTFANNEFSVIGGHVFKLTVSATCEIHLTQFGNVMERKDDPDFNLKLLK